MPDIVLEWAGRDYRIPDSRAFDLGERVEDIVTLSELGEMTARPKFHKIARVYGEMLRYAGAKVTDREVHSEMMAQVKQAMTMVATGADKSDIETKAKHQIAASAIATLVAILMDGAPSSGGEEPEKGNAS